MRGSVEPVKITYGSSSPGGARTITTPSLQARPFIARTSYINACTGLSLSRNKVVDLLNQMGHIATPSTPSSSNEFKPLNARTDVPAYEVEDTIDILVPPTRPDILHECDIMEDAAVAYGFNNLKRTFPATNTVAKPFPINKLSDVVRRMCAESGWLEVLPLTLVRSSLPFPYRERVLKEGTGG